MDADRSASASKVFHNLWAGVEWTAWMHCVPQLSKLWSGSAKFQAWHCFRFWITKLNRKEFITKPQSQGTCWHWCLGSDEISCATFLYAEFQDISLSIDEDFASERTLRCSYLTGSPNIHGARTLTYSTFLERLSSENISCGYTDQIPLPSW